MAKAPSDWITRYRPLFLPSAILLSGMIVAAAILTTGGLGRISDSFPTGAVAGEVEISVDDDPGLGDPNAPVTMIEFSDYECPFCKSFFAETLPKIKEQYIDTGKVRFVYRDLPLSFHDPVATKEALAANCARDQKGDEGYFSYHDEIFARTASNGEGMKEADYAAAATKIGLDAAAFNHCLSTEEFRDEVAADLAYITEIAQNYSSVFSQGIGTPTFFIGQTRSSGTITAKVVQGALPFESFQQVIEEEQAAARSGLSKFLDWVRGLVK